MIDSLELISTACLWFAHLILLISIAYLTNRKPIELKVSTVFFLFYSLGALFSFEFDFFQYHVRYTPSPIALIAYVIADLLFISSSLYLYGRKKNKNHQYEILIDNARYGNIALVALAIFAQFVNVIFNWEYLLLPKNDYIAELNEGITPNLLFFTIPAESIIVGSILINPFKSRLPRWIVTALGIATLLLSAFQGYRHLILIFLLIGFFRRFAKFGGIGLITITLALTFAGEFSNLIKMWFYQILIDSDFDQVAYFQWYFSNVEWLLISSEQAAAAANFNLGMEVMQLGSDFLQFVRLLPFTTALVDSSQTTTDLIGKVVGIEHGQGTAYNLQLFLVNTLFLGGFFIFIVLFVIRAVRSTVLLVYGLEIFYSLMRNSPSFWIGQIKMMMILLIFLFAVNAAMKFLTVIVVSVSRRHQRDSIHSMDVPEPA